MLKQWLIALLFKFANICAVLALLLWPNFAFGQAIPTSPGWYNIPDTKLRSVCPPNGFGGSGYDFSSYCRYVIEAWNGAVFDSARNRLIIWGGGHADYFGNEIYALDLNSLTIKRLTDPGLPLTTSGPCQESLVNGTQPNSRHTYDGIAYMANVDRMFVFGGSLSPCGSFSQATWAFNFSTSSWEKRNPSGSVPAAVPGIVSAYDPNSGKVFLHDNLDLYTYSYPTDSYQKLTNNGIGIDYHMTGVIDPVRKKFVIIGAGQSWLYDISPSSTYAKQTLNTVGGDAIINSLYPGLAYDPVSDRIVAWNGGDAVYSLNLDTNTWTAVTSYSGGPGTAVANGTYKRWSYSPTSGVFVVVNSVDQNAFTFRLTSGGSTPPPPPADTTAPSIPSGLIATALSSSQIYLSWSASTDNVGVTGYYVYRGVTRVASVSSTSYQDANLSSSTTYSYTVAAYDAAGNTSEQSAVATATTLAVTAPPPTGNIVTSFTLTSPITQAAAPFTLGQPFRQGDIPSGSSVVANIPNFQATVKSRWPDGSAQFAILAGRAALLADTPLRADLSAGTPPTAAPLTEQDLKTAGTNCLVTFSGIGIVELYDLIAVAGSYDASKNQWLPGKVLDWVQGSEMSSWIYSSPIGADPSLSAWFEVRLWKDGQVEILPWIENGYLNKSGVTEKNGTATVFISGVQRFSTNLTILHHTRTPLVSGTTFSNWTGVDPQVTLKHDTVYLQKSKLVPSYSANTPSNSTALTNLMTSYSPFGQANYPNVIGTAGYHPSIGLLPEWDVLYLTSAGDPRPLAAVTVNAYSAGRYGIHYRDEKTNRPFKFSSYPNLVINSVSSGVPSSGASSLNQYTPTPGGGSPPSWATSHAPSVGYLAYLLHGRLYFMEESQFAATLAYLKQTDTVRQYTKGILETKAGANTTRGAGWGLRTYAHAALATPDNDSLKPEFSNAIDENILYYHSRYLAQANNPQGVAQPYSDYTSGDNIYMHAMWMEDFLTAAFGYILDVKVNTSAVSTKATELFNWKAKSAVGRLGQAGVSTEYDFRDAAQYTIAVAPSDSADWNTGGGPWYATWGDLYRATLGSNAGTAPTNQLRGGYFPDPTAYWGNFQPSIAYAVTNNVPGASEAYARMTGASNWPQFLANANDNPVWSVIPLISDVSPPPGTVPNAPTNLTVR